MTTRRIPQRTVPILLAVLIAALSACAGDPGPPPQPAPPAPAAFVGEVDTPAPPGQDPLLAVEMVNGRAQAYVCEGRRLWGWFDTPAPATGTEVTMPAQTPPGGPAPGQPVALTLRLEPAAATGALTLTDGRRLPVTLSSATGTDGLYQTESIGPDGRFHATTATGNTAEGTVTAGRLTQTLSAPGRSVTLTGTATGFTAGDPATYQGLRTVVLGERSAGKTGKGSAFTETSPNI